MDIDERVRSIRCVTEVLRRRLKRHPLPTPESYIDVELTNSVEGDLPDFLGITIPMPTKGKAAPSLRIGIVLSKLFASEIELSFIADVENICSQFDFSSILIPMCGAIPEAIVNRTSSLSHVRMIELPTPKFARDFSTSNFEFISNEPQNTVNAANVIADALLRHLRKASHILLADVASSEYDNRYRRASAGTAFAMDREEELLAELVASLPERRGLIELGCGTGRHSLHLSGWFERIFAYDFSPGMIDTAKRNRRTLRAKAREKDADTKVEFAVRDIEMFPPTGDGKTPIDAIIGLFGMGSFVEDLARSLLYWYDLLQSDGRIALSFYNRDALTYTNPPPWRHTSLSALLDTQRQELVVKLPSGQTFFIFCKSYIQSELLKMMSLCFTDIEISSFPIVTGILPPDYIGDTGSAERKDLQQIFFDMDRALSRDNRWLGNYFFVTARKPRLTAETMFGASLPVFSAMSYLNHLSVLGIRYEVHDHDETHHANDIGIKMTKGAPYLKAVLAFAASDSKRQGPTPYMLVIRADDRLDRGKAAEAIGLKTGEWRIADKREVAAIFASDDFPLPVVGLAPEIDVVFDESIDLDKEWWCSGGNAQQSLQIRETPKYLKHARKAKLAIEKKR